MSAENNVEQLIQNNRLEVVRPDLIERVSTHMGEEFTQMPVYIAAQFDPFDEIASDPRLRASCKATGEWTAQGGSGPKKR